MSHKLTRALFVLAAAALAHPAPGASLTWDASGTSPTSPADGPGTWDTATPLWSDGTTDLPWNNANDDTATFGNGAGGSVTIDPAGVTTAGITFHKGYVLSGGPITLATGNASITGTPNGSTPAILSTLAGSNVSLALSGYVTFAAAANSYTGSTSLTGGAVFIGYSQNQHFDAPFGAAGNSLSLNNTMIGANGSSSGASVSYQTPYNITVSGYTIIQSGKNFTIGALSPTLYTVRGDGILTLNSNLASGTNNISSSFSGTGPDAFTGTLRLTTNGSNAVKLNPPSAIANAGNFLGVPNGTIECDAAVAPQTVGQPYTFTFGALTGSGQLGGGFTNATIATYSVGSLGLSTTYSGTIKGNAALTLTGGSLTLSTPSYNPNTYVGPTNITGGTLVLAATNLTATSSISVAAGATLRLQPGASVKTSLLNLSFGSTLDITTNPETFVDSSLPGHDGATYIAAVASAYHNGAWDAPGITSSAAASDPTHSTAIGYLYTGSTLTLRYTYYGDANLDGTVDADDYVLLDDGYATSGSVWQHGDFNYDGQVTSADYLLIDHTLATQSGSLSPDFLAERASQFGAQYVDALIASIPEPSTAALFPAVFALRRRRP